MPKGIYQHKSQQGFQRGYFHTEKWKTMMREKGLARKQRLGKMVKCNWCNKEIYKQRFRFKIQKNYFCSKECKARFESNKKKGIYPPELEKSKGHKKLNGHVTPLNERIRKSIEFCLWRNSIFARDNWTCQKYKIKGGKLHPHHIQNFAQYPELRFAIDNGITLSEKAHREFHKKYGTKNNTREQLEEFFKQPIVKKL